MGVTLAQLVKASVGQADVHRFEPDLGHNLLSCGVFLVKSRHFGLPLAQTIRPNWQSLSAGRSVAIQTWSIYKVYTWRDEENYCSKSERLITRLYFSESIDIITIFVFSSKIDWEYPIFMKLTLCDLMWLSRSSEVKGLGAKWKAILWVPIYEYCNYSPSSTLLMILTLEILNFSRIHVLWCHITGSASICAKIVTKIFTWTLSIFWSLSF